MTLPTITVPPGTPIFLAEGHGITLLPVFADVPAGSGHTRKRRVRTSASRIVDVSLALDAAQMAAVDDWFENTLAAGSRQFAAHVQNQGPGRLWWTAEWKEAYQSEPRGNGRWRITGQLILSGVGSEIGPDTGNLAVQFGVALTGTAELLANTALNVSFGVDIVVSIPLSVSFGVDIQVLMSSYRLRDGGGFSLRAGGGKRLRESIYG